jgi:hypothetical protein
LPSSSVYLAGKLVTTLFKLLTPPLSGAGPHSSACWVGCLRERGFSKAFALAIGGGSAVRFDGPVPLYAAILERVVLPVLLPLLKIAAGCFLFCTRHAYLAAGGFDEAFFWSEEVAFGKRLKRQGRFVILRAFVITRAARFGHTPPWVCCASAFGWHSGSARAWITGTARDSGQRVRRLTTREGEGQSLRQRRLASVPHRECAIWGSITIDASSQLCICAESRRPIRVNGGANFDQSRSTREILWGRTSA